MESANQLPIVEEKVFTFELSSIGCVRESLPSLITRVKYPPLLVLVPDFNSLSVVVINDESPSK
jgi:hypothetical protein